MNSIKNNQNIGKSDREHIYNIYKNKNDLKNLTLDYNEYKNTINDIEEFRNVNVGKDNIPSTSKNDRNKSLIPKLKS